MGNKNGVVTETDKFMVSGFLSSCWELESSDEADTSQKGIS